jgi:8-oxo-dGTP diphosphatase
METKQAYYDSLPRKRSAVGVLIFRGDLLLVVQPAYKPNALVPGGVVEKAESPLEAALRECREEIGLEVEITSFLCADYKRGTPDIGDAVHFLFLGKIPEAAEIKIDPKEIQSFAWVPVEEALTKFDVHLATRVRCGLLALERSAPAYCEDGEIIF